MTRIAIALSLIAAAAAPLMVAPGALAQSKPVSRAKIVQDLADCRKLTDNAARLACYDAAAASLETAEAKGDIVVVDREQARTVRRQAFGFALPSISMFEKGETREDLENVTGSVAAARQNGAGKWVIELADGAGTWLQVDNNELHRDPKAGAPVKIRKAAVGSFLMSIGNGGGFRVRRVE
jgi:hypothetical protein